MPTNYWLIKSEGDCYSIDDLKRDKRTAWTGVRNYQARNYLRAMEKGDLCLFYHSSSDPTGVYGIATVVGAPTKDVTALDPKDEHYDPKREWTSVDMQFTEKLAQPVPLEELKRDPELAKMLVCRPGQRLSVMPVEKRHFEKVVKVGGKK